VRRLVARQPLPGYCLELERLFDATGLIGEFIVLKPVEPGPVDESTEPPSRYRDFGRKSIGTSGAPISGLRAQAVNTDRGNAQTFQQLPLALDPLNSSNESNSKDTRARVRESSAGQSPVSGARR